MLLTHFKELTPMITDEFGGEVQDFVGDQIFAIFNKRGDQQDHALQAARAAAPRRSPICTRCNGRLPAR